MAVVFKVGFLSSGPGVVYIFTVKIKTQQGLTSNMNIDGIPFGIFLVFLELHPKNYCLVRAI
jgi:hypothetical protein